MFASARAAARGNFAKRIPGPCPVLASVVIQKTERFEARTGTAQGGLARSRALGSLSANRREPALPADGPPPCDGGGKPDGAYAPLNRDPHSLSRCTAPDLCFRSLPLPGRAYAHTVCDPRFLAIANRFIYCRVLGVANNPTYLPGSRLDAHMTRFRGRHSPQLIQMMSRRGCLAQPRGCQLSTPQLT